MQAIKDYLVRLRSDNPLVQTALRLHAFKHGFRIGFANNCISLRKADRELVLNKAQYVQVPIMMECFDQFFDSVEGLNIAGRTVLNFSQPGLHRYLRGKVAFYFPTIPEEDSMEAYTHSYMPQPGDVVWDVGAHAGATAYFLAQFVGPTGKVYAFEPDELNYDYLLRNIELNEMENVIPVKKALAGATGLATFNMDGTMGAGLSQYLVYTEESCFKQVPTITLPDACKEFGGVPQYVKMDIEGAEVAVVEAAQDFLETHPIHFAIESYHPIKPGGELTSVALDRLFKSVGYNVRDSDEFGQMFTWADPQS
jgi:FkbM family methyltransferase